MGLPAVLVLASGQAMAWTSAASLAQDTAAPAPAPASPAPAAEPSPTPTPAPAEAAAPAPQQPVAPTAAPALAQPAATPTAPAAGGKAIGFNFKNAPWDLVVDFIARQTGLPVITEAPPPAAPVTFISGAEYSVDEALDIVNRMLWMHGLQLRREATFLLLSKVEDLKARARQFTGQVPESVGAAELVTLVVPLNNSTAAGMAERLGQLMTKGIGAITPLPQQNALVVVDTAASARRLQGILATLDSKPAADSEFRMFPLKHAEAQAVFNALKGLVAEKRTTVVIDKDGQRRVVQEENFEGLSIQPDARINAIIAVGPAARLRTVEDVIALLDSEGGEGGRREMVTYALSGVSADDAAQRVSALFAGDGPRARPTVLPLSAQSKVSIVGSVEQVRRAGKLLAEMDPGAAPTDGGAGVGGVGGVRRECVASIVPLKHLRAEQAQAVLARLMSPRQQSLLRYAPSPDGRGLIVSGPSDEADLLEKLLEAIDTEPKADRDVRQVRVSAGDPAAIGAKASQLYALSGKAETDPVTVLIEAEARSLTLVGSRAGLDVFAGLVRTAQEGAAVERETRMVAVSKSRPSELAGALQRAARVMLEPKDGREFVAPVIEPLDEAGRLLVRAEPAQFGVIEELVGVLDGTAGSASRQVRVIALKNGKAGEVAASLAGVLASTKGLTGAMGPAPAVEAIEATNSILAVGQPGQLAVVEQVAQALDAKQATERAPLRILRIETTDAVALAGTLTSQYAQRSPEERAKRPVEIHPDATTNTLLVSAHPDVFPDIERIVGELNTQRVFDAKGREIRIFPLRHAHAEDLARTIDQMYPEPPMPLDPRTRQPMPERRPPREVVVRADRTTNALIVDATVTKMGAFEALVKQLDSQQVTASVEVRTYRVQRANLDAAASALRSLVSSGGLAGLAAGQQGAVSISAEPVSRTLIVTAPAEAFAGLERVLKEIDTQPTRPVTGLRVFTLAGARADALAGVLRPVLVSRVRDMQQRGTIDAGVDPASLVEVAADGASNTLIVSAPDEVLAGAAEVVRALDAASLSGSQQMRMIPIDRSRADAAVIAQTLQRMLQQRGAMKVEVISAEELLKRTAPAKPGAEPAKETKGSSVEPWRRGSDDPGAGGAGVGGARGMGPPTRVVVMAAAVSAGALGRADESEAAPVTIAVDPVTNSIIVMGGAKAIEQVNALAAELQRQMPQEPTSVKVIRLPEGASGWAVSGTLNAVLGQLGRSGPDNPGGLTGRVSVQPDPEGTSLVVTANETDFALVTDLIAAFSKPGATSRLTVKVYPLQNIPAQSALQAIRDLFRARPEGAQARRVRSVELTVPGPDGAPGQPLTFDPTQVSMTIDPSNTAVLVAAPAEAIGMIDRFIALVDQSPQSDRLAVRVFELKNAKAPDAARTLQAALDAVRQGAPGGGRELPQARFLGDERTNALLVTATEAQIRQTERLLADLDKAVGEDGSEVVILPLQVARPSAVQRIIETVLAGRDPARRDRLAISAADDASMLVFRGTAEQVAEVKRLVGELDKPETTGALPVRSIALKRADAVTIATSLRQFFDQRAQAAARPGQGQRGRLSIVGDRRAGLLVVAANDDDFAQIEGLVAKFDAPAASRDLTFRAVGLANTRVGEIRQTVEQVLNQLRWTTMTAAQGRSDVPPADLLIFDFDERTNSIVMIGQGDQFEQAERIIRALDVPAAPGAEVALKAVRIQHADPRVVAQALQAAMNKQGRPWQSSDVEGVRVEVDGRTRTVVLVGRAERLKVAEGYISQLDTDAGAAREIAPITLRFAAAERVAQSLERFFRSRAAPGAPDSGPTLIGSRDGNVLIAAGGKDDLDLVRKLVSEMDQPEEDAGRTRELFTLKNGDAQEIAATLREQFPRSLAQREGLVIVTPQASTNALLVSAPEELFPRVAALVEQLDAPPAAEAVRIVTVTLSTARADDVAQSLTAALPKNVKVKVTPVRRTNSILLTGSDEAIAIVSAQIAKLDEQPSRQQEFVRLKLAHALASDVSFTLRQVLQRRQTPPGESPPAVSFSDDDNALLLSGAPDQIDEARRIIAQLDVPSEVKRTTEFVPLRFADAEQTARALEVFYGRYAPEAATPSARNVTIIANPVSKSLVISADETEWKGVRALLDKLDNEQYDTSRRLEIVALRHADAVALARALSESFAAPLRAELERERARQQERRARGEATGPDVPRVLLDTKEAVTITAEPLTNSLIIGAARDQMERLRAVVAQLDVPDSARLPEARIIPLRIGPASQIAQALRQTFTENAAGGARQQGPRSVVIIGEDKSNSLIVRAEEAQFAQISAMAETLQQEGDRSRSKVRVLALKNVPAARVALAVRTTFASVAREGGETLAVEVDRTANALVIASSEKVYEQIRQVAQELDAAAPGAKGPSDEAVAGLGQTVQIVDVENNAPAEVIRLLTQLGVTQAQPADRPGVVSEPVTLSALSSRRAIAVVGSQQDIISVAALVKALDASPAHADQTLAIVRLKTGAAAQVVAAVENMLKSAATDAASPPARALLEQIRRLNVQREPGGADASPLQLDLSKPIRVFAEAQTNSVVVASTKENVAAVRDLVGLLDRLPIGEAITVRLYPLQAAAAQRVAGVIRELFSQADRLRTLPGTTVRGEPTTQAGKGIMAPIAVSVDERTNSIIVAAQEDAAALVEVIVKQLDSDKGAGWVEPAVIALKHADARRIALTLRQVFVDGLRESPEAQALQRAVGRIAMLQQGKDPADPKNRIESDLFANLSSVVIVAQEPINAVLIVGSTSNIAVMRELVKMLDVPAASAANTFRVYTLQFAAADRVAGMLREIFRQQVQTGALRPEDDLAITSDARTNALVVSSSPRSFAIVEGLIAKLDGEAMNPSVGLHVIPVPAGNVAQLAPKIQQLMRDRIDAAQRSGAVASPRDTFSIQAEPATSSLIVAASEENLKIVRQLVEVLTQGAEALAGAQMIDVITVTSARVEQLVAALRELYVDRANRERGADAVRVTPDPRINALVVTGTAADVEAIRGLVQRLDGAPITAVTEIKRIELRKTDAVEVVRLLQNVLAGRPIAGGGALGQRQALVVRFLREARGAKDAAGQDVPSNLTEAQISGAIQEQVTLTAEPRTNSIVVNAPAQLMVLIESLVTDIDESAAGARAIEVFELVHADARAMAAVLRELFSLRQNGNTLVLVPERAGATGGGADGAGGPSSSPGFAAGPDDAGQFYPTLDERQQLSVTIDARTNSLIVSATPEYIEEVRKVVSRLDAKEVNERENLTFRLRNAKAQEAARTLRDYFTEESTRVRTLLGPDRVGSLVSQLEREVIVQGDDKSNSLLISVSPRYRAKVETLVKELDATPPQVLIQVLLAEVTLDQSGQFGIEARVGPFGGELYRGSFLGAGSPIGTALGVPNFSVASTDFELLVRALEAQGRLEVLSRPQLTVRNNERATFQVGENIGLADSVETFSNGVSQTRVRRDDVGIILDVTPSISADGYIRMDVKPEISALSDRVTQITENVQSSIITRRQVQTVVTVKDGETIVLGGLIQNRDEERKTKVPVLGDIPLLGEVFKSSRHTQTKTELLVLLTPRVIRSAEPEAVEFERELRENAIDELSKPDAVRRWIPVQPALPAPPPPLSPPPSPAPSPTPTGPSAKSAAPEPKP